MRAFRNRLGGPVMVVFLKEARDHLRDKRSIILSFVFPLLAPGLVALLLSIVAHASGGEHTTREIEIGLAGGEHSPEIVKFLESRSVEMRAAPADPDEQRLAVRQARFRLILVIPEEAATQDRFGLDVILDRGNPQSVADSNELLRGLVDYSRNAGRGYMEQHGMDPRLATPISVEEVNVGEPSNPATLFYNMIPPLLTFMIFMGAVYLTIDTTVGERERGSIEPLLSTPVARWELLLGKAFAALSFTAAIVAINLTAFRFLLLLAVSGTEGMAPVPPVSAFVGVFAAGLPLMVLAVAVQMAVSAVTRSAKEAQIYLGLLPVLPLLPGVMLVFNPVPAGALAGAVPILGQITIFLAVLNDKLVPWGAFVTSTLVTLLAAGLVFWGAARLYEREKMIFPA